MSVVEKLKSLFSRKSDDANAESSGDLSLATPDGSLDPMNTGSIETQQDSEAQPMMAEDSIDDESMQPGDSAEEADLISVPILGRRSVVIHQRILFTFLSISLLVL